MFTGYLACLDGILNLPAQRSFWLQQSASSDIQPGLGLTLFGSLYSCVDYVLFQLRVIGPYFDSWSITPSTSCFDNCTVKSLIASTIDW